MDKLLKVFKRSEIDLSLLLFVILQRIFFFIILYLILIQNSDYEFLRPFSNFLETFTRRWDGNSYLFIAENSYVTKGSEAGFIVFPPIYPLVVRGFSVIVSDFEKSAFIASNIFYLMSVFVFNKLLRLDYTQKFSRIVVVLLVIFPTSYFYSSGYPESVFLFFSISCFYFARKNKWTKAIIFASLATLTRPFGIVLWPAIFVLWLKESKEINNLILMISGFVVSAGLYLGINYYFFKDIFAFQKYLSLNWDKSFQLPWLGIIKSIKRFFSEGNEFSYRYFVGFWEAVASILSWLLVTISTSKIFKIYTPYWLFLFLGIIMFTSTNFILSSPRYLLSLFPIFIVLARVLNNKLLLGVWIVVSIILSFHFSIYFGKGMWGF